jgi:MSHA biogenesis protein MshO
VRARGYTLVELITVIVVGSVLAVGLTRLITAPIESFTAVDRRAQLLDAADGALVRMVRELRLALPNSVRIVGAGAIEFLRTVDGGRYRARVDGAGNGQVLDFNATAVAAFDVLGPLSRCADVDADALGRADCLNGDSDCLAIYNTGQVGADAWSGDNLAGLSAKDCAGAPITLGFSNADIPGWRFPRASPAQRFYVVDQPVRFSCDVGARVLSRRAGYRIEAVPPAVPTGGVGAVLARRVTGCRFDYDPGTATRAALVTLELSVAEAGENVTVLQQAHVPNAP